MKSDSSELMSDGNEPKEKSAATIVGTVLLFGVALVLIVLMALEVLGTDLGPFGFGRPAGPGARPVPAPGSNPGPGPLGEPGVGE